MSVSLFNPPVNKKGETRRVPRDEERLAGAEAKIGALAEKGKAHSAPLFMAHCLTRTDIAQRS